MSFDRAPAAKRSKPNNAGLPDKVQGQTPEGLLIASDDAYRVAFDDLSPDLLRKRLLEDGVVVVTGILQDEAEIASALQGFVDDAKDLVARKDSKTGKTLKPWEVQPKGNAGSSLWKGRGCALSHNAQRRRLQPKAREVYSMLYGTAPEDLVISCDAFALRLAAWDGRRAYPQQPSPHDPLKETTRRLLGSSLKLHQDATLDGAGGGGQEGTMIHGLKAAGFFPHCVQGAIVYREETVVPSHRCDPSHRLVYPGFVACPGPPEKLHNAAKRSDWHILPPEQFQGGDYGDVLSRLRYIPAPAGSLRLWRSDVIHSNTLMHKSLVKGLQPWDITRAAQFVCWGPRSITTPEATASKLAWAKQGGSHNHWPTTFSKGPRGGHMSDDGSWLRTLPAEKISLLPEQVVALGARRDPGVPNGPTAAADAPAVAAGDV